MTESEVQKFKIEEMLQRFEKDNIEMRKMSEETRHLMKKNRFFELGIVIAVAAVTLTFAKLFLMP